MSVWDSQNATLGSSHRPKNQHHRWGAMRWAHPGPKPRLCWDSLHQNTESPLLRASFENQLKPFRIIHEVARPCSFGLTSKLCFVDFGSRKTNAKFSLCGAAVHTAFAACWEEQDDLTGRRKKKALLRNAVPPLLPAHRASQGRHLRSRHSSLAHPSKEVTHMYLPPCTASQGWRVWGQPHIPQLLQPPRRLGRGWLPLNVPSQALYWLTGWANTRQGWKQEPGAGWVCTNNKAEGINQLWLLASLQGTFH